MRLRIKIKGWDLANRLQDDVFGFIHPIRGLIARDIGQGCQCGRQFGVNIPEFPIQSTDLVPNHAHRLDLCLALIGVFHFTDLF